MKSEFSFAFVLVLCSVMTIALALPTNRNLRNLDGSAERSQSNPEATTDDGNAGSTVEVTLADVVRGFNGTHFYNPFNLDQVLAAANNRTAFKFIPLATILLASVG